MEATHAEFAGYVARGYTGTQIFNTRRPPGDPLPRLALDGIAVVELGADGLCRHLRLWWHSQVAG